MLVNPCPLGDFYSILRMIPKNNPASSIHLSREALNTGENEKIGKGLDNIDGTYECVHSSRHLHVIWVNWRFV